MIKLNFMATNSTQNQIMRKTRQALPPLVVFRKRSDIHDGDRLSAINNYSPRFMLRFIFIHLTLFPLFFCSDWYHISQKSIIPCSISPAASQLIRHPLNHLLGLNCTIWCRAEVFTRCTKHTQKKRRSALFFYANNGKHKASYHHLPWAIPSMRINDLILIYL